MATCILLEYYTSKKRHLYTLSEAAGWTRDGNGVRWVNKRNKGE